MISVIVPVYNVEKYLQRCVDSLLQQDINQPFEIILVDDGSTDSSGEMCDLFQQQFPDRIRTVHKENGGLSSARNEGVVHSKGEWISFVDSDDYVSPGYLSVLEDLRKKFNADMSVISIKKTLEGNEVKENNNRFQDFALDRKASFFEMYVTKRFGWYVPAKLYRKEALLKHPFPYGYYEDSASQYLLIDECEKIAFGDYIAEYHYLERKESITTSCLSEKHFRIFEVCDELSGYIDTHYPEWQYVKVLLYQNGVLQLINRTQMTSRQFNDLFLKYRGMFRKNVWTILKRRELNFATKYYAVVLCSSSAIYKFQRKIMRLFLGERLN